MLPMCYACTSLEWNYKHLILVQRAFGDMKINTVYLPSCYFWAIENRWHCDSYLTKGSAQYKICLQYRTTVAMNKPFRDDEISCVHQVLFHFPKGGNKSFTEISWLIWDYIMLPTLLLVYTPIYHPEQRVLTSSVKSAEYLLHKSLVIVEMDTLHCFVSVFSVESICWVALENQLCSEPYEWRCFWWHKVVL